MKSKEADLPREDTVTWWYVVETVQWMQSAEGDDGRRPRCHTISHHPRTARLQEETCSTDRRQPLPPADHPPTRPPGRHGGPQRPPSAEEGATGPREV